MGPATDADIQLNERLPPSDELWLGQAPNTPFQSDPGLLAGAPQYERDSCHERWPTLRCTKAHRLHDIKTLCSACDRIDLSLIREGGPPVVLHPKFKTITTTAKTCRFCSLIAQCSRDKYIRLNFEDKLKLNDEDNEPVFLELRKGMLAASVPFPKMRETYIRDPDGNGRVLARFRVSFENYVNETLSNARQNDVLVFGDMHQASSVGATREALSQRLATELHRVLRQSACELCMPTQLRYAGKSVPLFYIPTPLLPKRVVEILEDPTSSILKLRLKTTTYQMAGHYITLSHRWGGLFTLKTTKATLKKHENGFDLEEMPRTFQEVILVAKALRIRYVWIDSLCIIQDDHEDWLEQSGKMGSIYQNATLTVAAHSATQCNEGFLWRSQVPPTLRISPAKGGPGFLVDLPDIDPQEALRRFTDSEINRRAWVLQELTLSSRTLHFVENKLFWECTHRSLSVQQSKIETTASLFRRASCLSDIYSIWLKLVAQYSKRQMTKSSDKLVAIAGLVEILLNQMDERQVYHCGVFAADLERSLLWYSAPRLCWPEVPRDKNPHRAPYWSWASFNGCLDFIHLGQGGEKTKKLFTITALQHQRYLNLTRFWRCNDLYIKAPVIRITAHTIVSVRADDFRLKPPRTSPLVTVFKKGFKPWQQSDTHGWYIPDTETSIPIGSYNNADNTTSLIFVAVSGHEVWGTDQLSGAWCLVVNPVSMHGNEVYQRFGIGYLQDIELLRSSVLAPEIITLI